MKKLGMAVLVGGWLVFSAMSVSASYVALGAQTDAKIASTDGNRIYFEVGRSYAFDNMESNVGDASGFNVVVGYPLFDRSLTQWPWSLVGECDSYPNVGSMGMLALRAGGPSPSDHFGWYLGGGLGISDSKISGTGMAMKYLIGIKFFTSFRPPVSVGLETSVLSFGKATYLNNALLLGIHF